MNILMLPSLYYPQIGGVEIAVENLSRQLRLLGHQIEIVTTRQPRSLLAEDWIGGIKVTRLPFVLPRLSGRSFFTFPVRFLQCLLGLEGVLGSGKFDVVNLHYLCEAGLYAGLSCGWRRLPVVASLHGADIEQIPLVNPVQRRVTCNVVRRASAITTNSESLARSVSDLVGTGVRERLSVLGNGVNLEEFDGVAERSPGLPKRYILAYGRMVHKKGFDILIRAFEDVSKREEAVDLVLVGDGVERPKVEQLVAERRLDRRVRFLGWQPNRSIVNFLRFAEFCVIPSRSEPFGIVALEAMACRKAVVAMAVGGLKEVVADGQTGILVAPHTPQALADGIIRLLSQEGLADRLGESGRRKVEAEYTWKSVAERYVSVFDSAIQEKARVRARSPERTRIADRRSARS